MVRVAKTDSVTYHLKDDQDEPISGGFYEQELTKVPYPDVYLVKKSTFRKVVGIR